MFEKLWNAQPDNTLRRVHLTYRDATTGNNVDPGDLSGKKANVRLNGTGALVATSLDLGKLNQADHLGAGYVEFTLAELTAFDHGELIISVSGITGVKVEDAQATLYTFNPNDPGATAAQIASQVRTELAAELGDIVALNTRVPSDPADESMVEAAVTAVLNAVNALNDLDAVGVRAAVGLAAANLDVQFGAIPTAVENADALLARNQKGGADGPPEESVSAALAGGFLLFSGGDTGTLVVNNGDGTPAYSRTLTRDLTKLLGAIISAVSA